MKLRTTLFIVLIVIPLLVGITLRLLVLAGDTRAAQHELALQHFTEEDIASGREYYSAYQPGGAVSVFLYWAMLGVLTFSGLTRWLVERTRSAARGNLLLHVLLVGVPLFIAIRLILLPISIYHSFILEGEFGFRRLDFLPWLLRVVKGWGVSIVTQTLVATGFLWVVRRFRDRWLWPVWLGGIGFGYISIILWPLIILPLFYSITPVPDGDLQQGIAGLAERAGVVIDDISMIDQSRVSGHTNAFFVGIGDRRSIYLYDTLAEDHTVPEIMSVVAHEMGHWHHRHMLKGWILGTLASLAGLMLLRRWLADARVCAALRIEGPGDVAILPLFWVLLGVVSVYTSPIESGISRAFERQADRFSLDMMGSPSTFIDMKVNSARANRRDLLPHPWVQTWRGSHPTVLERIAAAETWTPPASGPTSQAGQPPVAGATTDAAPEAASEAAPAAARSSGASPTSGAP